MLKNIYLFGRRVGDSRLPVLVESREEFCTAHSCSEGLRGLAEVLEGIVSRDYDSDYKGPINVIKHAPVTDLAYAQPDYDTYELPERQKQSFQRLLLPKKIKINWIDHRQDKEFIEQLAFWKDYFAKHPVED